MSEESKLAEKLEEKEKEIKFSEEELDKVKSIQEKYYTVQLDLGNLQIARFGLKNQLSKLLIEEEELQKKFIEIQNDEKKFLDDTTKKYGQGSLNPETGLFKPVK